MPKNTQVVDIKPTNFLVDDATPKNIQVFDTKPQESVFGDTSFTALLLVQGMSLGPSMFFLYVTYPVSILNRV